jgi:hypothetical protein
MLAVLRLGLFSYWMNGYWSASVAALGGALVLGALPRLRRHARVNDSLWMAAGLAILANSRPYEGLILSLPVAGAMLLWLLRPRRPSTSIVLDRVVVPMVLLLTLAGVATGYYYWRITGSPFRTAYAVDRAAYGTVPFFLWQKPFPEPTYRHAVLREFYEGELGAYHYKRTLAGFYINRSSWLWSSWGVYLGPLLTVPLLGFPWLFHDRKMRFLLLTGFIFLLAVMVETWLLPHYFAPATGLLWLLAVQGMRHLAQWRWLGKEIGRSLVRALPVIACAMVLLRVGAVVAHAQIEPPWPRGNLQRARILRELERSPGQHLIVVRYSQQHDTNAEWVYNAAEIDAAKVVWARDMGEVNNRELLEYFRNSRVWSLDADDAHPRLELYPGSASRNWQPRP